ncbi:MAG: hypothetical protein QXP29_05535 [Candidatus Nezhaarchaeales archaeon]
MKGYEDGKDDHRIWYYCSVCGERIYTYPNDEGHKAMIEYMKQHGWGHAKCHEKR